VQKCTKPSDLKHLKAVNIVILAFIYAHLMAQVAPGFTPNLGQWEGPSMYRSPIEHGHLWVVNNGIVYNRWGADAAEAAHSRSTQDYSGKGQAIKLEFKGANFKNAIETEAQGHYSNFFIGNNPKNWKTKVKTYQTLYFSNIYPNVDLRLISTEVGFKYDILADNPKYLEQVKLVYHGVNYLKIEENILKIGTVHGEIIEKIPAAWLDLGQNLKESIDVKYQLTDSMVTFSIPNRLRRNKPLVIDPILVFSTFSGSTADNFGCTATPDDNGNAYSGGTVFGFGFPTTTGAYDITFNFGTNGNNDGYGPGRDCGILKFSPDGKQLYFATYLGGAGNEQPHSMIADNQGDLYILSSTESINFPTTSSYSPSLNGGYDFNISKLSSDGTQLMASTFMGGSEMDALLAYRAGTVQINTIPLLYNYADEFRGEIILANNAVLVCGSTHSPNFPSTKTGDALDGFNDAVVFSLSLDLLTLNWSRIIGGNGNESFYGLSQGINNELFVSGGTTSTNLNSKYPVFANTYGGGIADGFIVKLDITNGELLKGRYHGTPFYDQAYFVQTDNSGLPYIYGQTEGIIPEIGAQLSYGQKGQFISRFDRDLTAMNLNCNIGGTNSIPNISPSAFLVDECERIFISGWGGATNSALIGKTSRNRGFTTGLPVTPDAIRTTSDGSDFYVAVFSKNMSSLLYGTYFGGQSTSFVDADEHVDGGTSRFDKKGVIYQAVCGGCGRNEQFPTTAGAYSRSMRSDNCNNAVFKIDFENLNRKPFIPDTFISVIATDLINFSLNISDPDAFDELFLNIDYIQKPNAPGADTPTIALTRGPSIPNGGINRLTRLNFNWATTCRNISPDTHVFRIQLRDEGCPSQDTHYAYIRILINPPPIIIPPESVCLNFDRATNELIITWDSTSHNMRYFKRIDLRMDKPDGITETLIGTSTVNGGTYSLVMPTDPFTEDYCFYMVGINICDVETFPIEKFCTIRELNRPISGVHLKRVTVQNDSRVFVEWYGSDEPDFKEYEVYRSKRGTGKAFELFKRTKDTFLYDESYDVDLESYCYAIIVTDRCGHASMKSPDQCNMVINGSEKGNPDFLFNLNWQPYINWDNAVARYQLEYRNDIENWKFGNSTQDISTQNITNNYDWGGYWFRVTATENSAQSFTSESNWIYLIHQPEMWVPSGMSPNADGKNDLWGVTPVFAKTFHMRVFNRWGEKVWETTDKKDQWNGRTQDKKVEDRVYAWYLTFTGWDDKEYKMTGTVTLIH
jgi:gliding motility-associated-like protein